MSGGARPAAAPPVIGLEVHVQLRTATKLFCGNRAVYGDPPNSHVCPVCLGLPGALPVLNGRAVELAVRTALGLRCAVHPRSAFARKHYFYPDLPKGYQITQHLHPLATGGHLDGGDGPAGRVRIRRVHLEEDSGKLDHDLRPDATLVDLNRAGVPLVEIVTEPDLRSPEHARDFLTRLRRLLEYLDVSDCNMEEGGLRVDANVSIRGPGGAPGPRTEIKNLNSFRAVERALRYEIARQRRLAERGAVVRAATLLWDAARGQARPVRSKEELHDYRYFPEPDLPPLLLPPELLRRARAELPEAPWDRAARLVRDHGIRAQHAAALTASRGLADFYEAVVRAGAGAEEAAGWVLGELSAALNASRVAPSDLRITPVELARLLTRMADGTLSRPAARRLFERMIRSGRGLEEVLREGDWTQVRDEAALAGWVDEAGRASPAEVARLRAGEMRLLGYFVGEVMRRSEGRADPQRAAELVRERLGGGAAG